MYAAMLTIKKLFCYQLWKKIEEVFFKPGANKLQKRLLKEQTN